MKQVDSKRTNTINFVINPRARDFLLQIVEKIKFNKTISTFQILNKMERNFYRSYLDEELIQPKETYSQIIYTTDFCSKISMSKIVDRIENNEYTNYEQFIIDVIINFRGKYRRKKHDDIIERFYLTLQIINLVANNEKFKKIKLLDYFTLFEIQTLNTKNIKQTEQEIIRNFNIIEGYRPIFNKYAKQIDEIRTSSLESSWEVCLGNGIAIPFEGINWKPLVLGQELIEQQVWGLDFDQIARLYFFLPLQASEEQKWQFLSKKMLIAVNLLNKPTVEDSLDLILEEEDEDDKFSLNDQYYAALLKNNLEIVKNTMNQTFYLRSKGMGIICKSKEGIKANTYITDYIGDVYTTELWFEREEILKQNRKVKKHYQITSQGNRCITDFYNIYMERNLDQDEKGIQYLVIDPLNNGNYSSRLSHSCEPNCMIVQVIRDYKYCLSLFSIRDIEYGEELTFNYDSKTTDIEEYNNSVCFCGQRLCQHYYIKYHQNHTITEDNLIWNLGSIYYILKHSHSKISYFSQLKMFRIGTLITDNCPQWIIKWMLKLLKIRTQFKKAASDKLDKQDFLQTLYESLIIRVNWLKHYSQKVGLVDPPLQLVDEHKFLQYKLHELSMIETILQENNQTKGVTLLQNMIANQTSYDLVNYFKTCYFLLAMVIDSKLRNLKEFLIRKSMISVYFTCEIPDQMTSDVYEEFQNYEHYLKANHSSRIEYTDELLLKIICSWNNDNLDFKEFSSKFLFQKMLDTQLEELYNEQKKMKIYGSFAFDLVYYKKYLNNRVGKFEDIINKILDNHQNHNNSEEWVILWSENCKISHSNNLKHINTLRKSTANFLLDDFYERYILINKDEYESDQFYEQSQEREPQIKKKQKLETSELINMEIKQMPPPDSYVYSFEKFGEGCREGRKKAIQVSLQKAQVLSEYYANLDKAKGVINPEVPGEYKSVYFYKVDDFDRGYEEAFVQRFNQEFPELYVKYYNLFIKQPEQFNNIEKNAWPSKQKYSNQQKYFENNNSNQKQKWYHEKNNYLQNNQTNIMFNKISVKSDNEQTLIIKKNEENNIQSKQVISSFQDRDIQNQSPSQNNDVQNQTYNYQNNYTKYKQYQNYQNENNKEWHNYKKQNTNQNTQHRDYRQQYIQKQDIQTGQNEQNYNNWNNNNTSYQKYQNNQNNYYQQKNYHFKSYYQNNSQLELEAHNGYIKQDYHKKDAQGNEDQQIFKNTDQSYQQFKGNEDYTQSQYNNYQNRSSYTNNHYNKCQKSFNNNNYSQGYQNNQRNFKNFSNNNHNRKINNNKYNSPNNWENNDNQELQSSQFQKDISSEQKQNSPTNVVEQQNDQQTEQEKIDAWLYLSNENKSSSNVSHQNRGYQNYNRGYQNYTRGRNSSKSSRYTQRSFQRRF